VSAIAISVATAIPPLTYFIPQVSSFVITSLRDNVFQILSTRHYRDTIRYLRVRDTMNFITRLLERASWTDTASLCDDGDKAN
jgi:hypothetical protein